MAVSDLPTYYGNLSYTIKSAGLPDGRPGRVVVVRLGGNLSILPGKIVLKSPLGGKIESVSGDGHWLPEEANEIRIERLPATVTIRYLP